MNDTSPGYYFDINLLVCLLVHYYNLLTMLKGMENRRMLRFNLMMMVMFSGGNYQNDLGFGLRLDLW